MHSAVVAGATGGVGRRVVHFLALDPRVESVTAVTRRPRDDQTQLFDLPEQAAAKVKFVVVDYDQLADEGTGADLLAPHSIGMSALGLYTKAAKSEEHFRRVEIAYNTAVARAAVAGGASRFSYLSGQGAKKGSWMMFARVKADAEQALRDVEGMEQSCAVRPGFIMERVSEKTGVPGEELLAWLFRSLGLDKMGFAVTTDEIAKSMIQTTMAPADTVQDVYENNDIRGSAACYDQELAAAVAGHDEFEAETQ